ncbi:MULTISPECIES: ATP-binding protein [unclassified Streptomyces]|uniref:ATP-binding protein n=1 Tax=unclassified Streptomyces TaxID=2593676 RepID=UPI0036585D08
MKRPCGKPAEAAARRLSSVRRDVRGQLERWGLGELADDAALVVSELLGNALRHGLPPISVSLTLQGSERGQTVRIGVTDAGTAFNVEFVRSKWRHPSGWLSTRGRGLWLVDAVACAWSDLPGGFGHTVWAELPCSTCS